MSGHWLDVIVRELGAELGSCVIAGACEAAAGPDAYSEHEEALVLRAVPRRVAEFRAGRQLARRLLAELGFASAAIPADEARRPLWPAGSVGSITHSNGACLVLVARVDDVLTLGVDMERSRELEPGLWAEIANERELDHVRRAEAPGLHALRLFSAKESVYKAQHPLTRRALEFHDVAVELDGGEFRARTTRGEELPNGPIWRGIQLDSDGWIASALVVRARDHQHAK